LLLSFIILYLIFTVLAGVWSSRHVRTSSDFMLAGRSLPLVLSTSALFATWFGSETVFGASSEFLKGGLYAVIEDPFGAALCLFLFGFLFARKLYEMNLLTLGDFFRVRYGRRSELLSCIFMVPSYFGYAAGQMVALGLILNVVTGVAVWEGVLIGAAVVTLYTYVGGMWAISVTDFIQSIVIISGLLVLAVLLSHRAGGVVKIFSEVPPATFKFFPKNSATDIIKYVAAWSVLGLGSIPSQDVFQRVMSSGSAKVAVRSCFYSAILYLTVAMLPLFISLCAKHLYNDQLLGDTQLVLPIMVLAHTSLAVQVLFFGSLLSAIMSTTSSSILAPAAILSENIIKPILNNRPTDKQLLLLTRASILVISASSAAMACWKSDIYELVAGSSIMSLVSLFVPLAMGMYWKKASARGALLSMITGMITWIFFELWPIVIPSLIPALIASFAGMIVGSVWPGNRMYNTEYDHNRTKPAE
jgi:solute:Na+ symporter, SSS family